MNSPAPQPERLECAGDLRVAFQSFVAQRDFPCVGAKSALAREDMTFMTARDITSAWDDLEIHSRLSAFARSFRDNPHPFQSFILLFEQPTSLSEESFECALWQRLQSLTDKDAWRGEPTDTNVSSDPDDPHFALSYGGEAFFVVGLHPRASRPARRFQTPALVFNPHQQFESLRADQRYDQLRDKIMERDLALAGSHNPMLARHGEGSAAPQYSGRHVGDAWKCPFVARDQTSSGAEDKEWRKKPIAGW